MDGHDNSTQRTAVIWFNRTLTLSHCENREIWYFWCEGWCHSVTTKLHHCNATSYQERDRILLKETDIIVRIDWLVEEHGIKCTDA